MPLLVNIYCAPTPRHLDTNTQSPTEKFLLIENLFEVESVPQAVHKYVKVSIKVNGIPPKRME